MNDHAECIAGAICFCGCLLVLFLFGNMIGHAQMQIPEGWKLVPIQLTREMITAAKDCQDADPEDGYESELYCAYQAMLSVVPTPKKN